MHGVSFTKTSLCGAWLYNVTTSWSSSFSPWRWKQCALPKCHHHGASTEKETNMKTESSWNFKLLKWVLILCISWKRICIKFGWIWTLSDSRLIEADAKSLNSLSGNSGHSRKSSDTSQISLTSGKQVFVKWLKLFCCCCCCVCVCVCVCVHDCPYDLCDDLRY